MAVLFLQILSVIARKRFRYLWDASATPFRPIADAHKSLCVPAKPNPGMGCTYGCATFTRDVANF